jgi:hypothetical protein
LLFAAGISALSFEYLLNRRCDLIWHSRLTIDSRNIELIKKVFSWKTIEKPEENNNIPEVLNEVVNVLETSWREAALHLKLTWKIIAINAAVFVCWQIPTLNLFMSRHFVHVSNSGRVYTMLTSVFRYIINF